MKKKKCFKCGSEKNIELFYRHPQMPDGRVGKCIECAKNDSILKYRENKKQPDFIEKERIRDRERYHRLNYREKYKKTNEEKQRAMSKYWETYPEKKKIKNLSQRVKIQRGNQRHHWSYNIEHAKDIIELTVRDHSKLHRYTIYDQERMMYRTTGGVLLDTKEKHIEYFNSLKNMP